MSINEKRLHEELGVRVRRLRDEAGDSQGALADALGLSRTSVVNIEAGRQRPPLVTLYRIAKRYGVSLTQLLPPLGDVDVDQETERVIQNALDGESRSASTIASFVKHVRST